MGPLEDNISILGYDYETVHEKIILIQNFLSDDEIVRIKDQIALASEEDWKTHYLNGVRGLAKRKYGRDDIENLVNEGLVEITEHWVDKNLMLDNGISEKITSRIHKIFSFDNDLLFDGVGTIQRQYAGARLTEHVDNHSDPSIKYAVIMYINDDYRDGELIFPRLKFSIKPPSRSMIIFPSGEDFLHGVEAPGEGPIRYVLPSFVRGRA